MNDNIKTFLIEKVLGTTLAILLGALVVWLAWEGLNQIILIPASEKMLGEARVSVRVDNTQDTTYVIQKYRKDVVPANGFLEMLKDSTIKVYSWKDTELVFLNRDSAVLKKDQINIERDLSYANGEAVEIETID